MNNACNETLYKHVTIVWFVGKTHVYSTHKFIIMTKRVVFFLSPLMSGKVDSVCRDKQGRMSSCPKPERKYAKDSCVHEMMKMN